MATAEKYIHLMYLIWEQDELTAKVTEVLLGRLGAGVEVHILYDWLSCISYKKDELKRLAAAGAVVAPCYKRLPQINYRNHMKMVIIDGKSVYSGGMNMGQEYIDGGRASTCGATPRSASADRWSRPTSCSSPRRGCTTGHGGPGHRLHAAARGASPARGHPGAGAPLSVQTTFKTNRDVFIVALLNARERVRIESPYFIPDEPLMTAMCTAATSGIDVRFMMTGVPDKKIPFNAAMAYFPQLLRSGVKVYRYTAGFLHAKTVTVDDQLSIIGTCNWDIRSHHPARRGGLRVLRPGRRDTIRGAVRARHRGLRADHHGLPAVAEPWPALPQLLLARLFSRLL